MDVIKTYTLVAYGWLGLSIAIIGAGLWIAFRRSNFRAAWVLVLGGLSFLAWSISHLHPIIQLGRFGGEFPSLLEVQRDHHACERQVALSREAEKSAWDRAVESIKGDLETLRAQLGTAQAAMQTCRSESEKDHDLLVKEKTALQFTIEKLKAEAVAEKSTREATEQRAAELNSQLGAAQNDLSQAHTKLRVIEQTATQTKLALESLVVELKSGLGRERRSGSYSLYQKGQAEKALEESREVFSRNLARIADELSMERGAHASTMTELERLRQSGFTKSSAVTLSNRFEGNAFSLALFPNSEFILDRKRQYFAINMKDQGGQNFVKFESGSISMEKPAEMDFLSALEELKGYLLSAVPSADATIFYIRGAATAAPIRTRKPLPGGVTVSGQISYLPRSKDRDGFTADSQGHTIGASYDNDDLPYLRAAYLREKVLAAIPSAQVFILEGNIGATTAPEIILSFDLRN
jgi:hypothetical protein